MVKVNFDGHELEFERELIETFEREVLDSFAETARIYLMADFDKESTDEVFANHTEKEIKDVIINAAKEEIALHKGEI